MSGKDDCSKKKIAHVRKVYIQNVSKPQNRFSLLLFRSHHDRWPALAPPLCICRFMTLLFISVLRSFSISSSFRSFSMRKRSSCSFIFCSFRAPCLCRFATPFNKRRISTLFSNASSSSVSFGSRCIQSASESDDSSWGPSLTGSPNFSTHCWTNVQKTDGKLDLSNQRTTDQSTTRTLSLSLHSLSHSVCRCMHVGICNLFSSDLCVFLKSISRFIISTIRVDSLLIWLFLFRGPLLFKDTKNEGRGMFSVFHTVQGQEPLVFMTILIFVPLFDGDKTMRHPTK